MNESQYRMWRTRLRQVTAALVAEAVAGGAVCTQVGVVDCLVNPERPADGFVTPRHGAVWVPDAQVRAALDELRGQGGPARLRLLDGLYPPAFLSAMRGLGLSVVAEQQLLLWPLDFEGDHAGAELSARPTLVREDVRKWQLITGMQDTPPPGAHDWLLGWNGEIAGAARFGATGGRAARLYAWHGTGAGESPLNASLLLTAACAAPALAADLLYAEAGDAENRALLREIGFRDSGSVLTWEEAE
ncbi:MAG: hypothetical protein U0452_09555 [Anaerolineae bacterium]